MNKLPILLFILALIPLSVFAGGNRDSVEVTIENNTGTKATHIIIFEGNEKHKKIKTTFRNGTSNVLRLKKGTPYFIYLYNTEERYFASGRQEWDTDTANIVFYRRDWVPMNTMQKLEKALSWPFY